MAWRNRALKFADYKAHIILADICKNADAREEVELVGLESAFNGIAGEIC
jgi:hypothetical protein